MYISQLEEEHRQIKLALAKGHSALDLRLVGLIRWIKDVV